MVEGVFQPVRVTASGSKGIATSLGCDARTEDTITLLVDWEKIGEEHIRGVGVYTASFVLFFSLSII